MLGGPNATDTYMLIANTSPFDGVARVTLSFEDDGARVARDYTVPAHSRVNVPIRDDFPQAMGRRFGTLVESQGTLPAQLVVERAMYADSGKERWAAGTNAQGTPLGEERVITITPQGVTPRVLVVSPGERIDGAQSRHGGAPDLLRTLSRTFDLSGPEPGRLPRPGRITRVGQLQRRRHVPVPGRRPPGTAAESGVPGVRHRALMDHGSALTNVERSNATNALTLRRRTLRSDR